MSSIDSPEARPPDLSGWGSWSDADEQRRISSLDATPEQRLTWLEEAIELAFRSGALPDSRRDGA